MARELGPRRPSGWVLAKAGGRGPGRGTVQAVYCTEDPPEAPVLTLERALDAAQHPGTRLCCASHSSNRASLRAVRHAYSSDRNSATTVNASR
ncbi:hypothetical protein [Streptomyces sp. NPDC096339]|uniref:hypothetical protein n=1 Tax=Streptomyces sp. NPDC096339 TaxID=3366086 RepID=UPI00381D85E4